MSFFDIKSDEINVKYGMYDLCPEREGARGSLRYILSDFADIKQSYFRLGFHLDEFIRCKYYEDFGYLTFKEFALENIPLDYSSINRCINVFNMTCQHADGIGGAKQMFMQDKYKDYSYSQLVEMLSLNDEQRKQVKSSMSVRQIREVKSSNVNSSAPPAPAVPDVPEVNCDVAIDGDSLMSFIVSKVLLKYDQSSMKNIIRSARSMWFQKDGRQFKIMISESDIKE